jgi:RNA polymerase sigma-70 factor (ECF subfamily)
MTPALAETLFEEHADRLLAFARTLTKGDLDAAEELRAETFARALGSEFRGESRPFTWLAAILRHAHLDRARTASRRPPLEELVAAVDARASTPLELAESVEVAALVRAAVARLRAEHREVVEACYLDDEGFDAYADRAGIARGTARSRSFHARAALRDVLRSLDPSSGYSATRRRSSSDASLTARASGS